METCIVTSTGIKDGKPYSFLTPIRQGVSKNGNVYGFLDTDRAIRREEKLQIGLMVNGEIQFSQITPTANA